jgi:SAM-dependent methyltransferase
LPFARVAFIGVQELLQHQWVRLTAEDPGHSRRYIERFQALAAAGADLAGEARCLDAMLPRGSRILDAGSGTGRVGAHLALAGHEVVGVDIDPELVAAARQAHPGVRWLIGDLATLDLPALGISEPFDAIVCAGNVMTFVAPAARTGVLRRLRAHLRDDGRAVFGFGAGRGYDFADFIADAATAGLIPDLLLSTWDLRPFGTGSEFLVAILRPA